MLKYALRPGMGNSMTTGALQDKGWQLDRIMAVLARAKGRSLSAVERQDLCHLLCYASPAQIAQATGVKPDTVRSRLSKGLYRYVEDVAHWAGEMEQVAQSGDVPRILEQLGYRRSPLLGWASSPEAPILSPAASPVASPTVAMQYWQECSSPWGDRDWQTRYLSAAEIHTLGEGLIQQWRSLREEGTYESCIHLWQISKGFTYLYESQWPHRLEILNDLWQVAQDEEDRSWMAEAASELAWTLIVSDRSATDSAAQWLEDAVQLQQERSRLFRFNLAIHHAVFHLNQTALDQSDRYLSAAKDILPPSAPSRDFHRCSVNLHLYTGEQAFLAQDYGTAQRHYQQARHHAQQAQWHRATVAAQNWLTAIALQQGDLQTAQHWLNDSYDKVKSQYDPRCLAFCQKHYALLQQRLGNPTEARHWAQQAIHTFQTLALPTEAIALRDILTPES